MKPFDVTYTFKDFFKFNKKNLKKKTILRKCKAFVSKKDTFPVMFFSKNYSMLVDHGVTYLT